MQTNMVITTDVNYNNLLEKIRTCRSEEECTKKLKRKAIRVNINKSLPLVVVKSAAMLNKVDVYVDNISYAGLGFYSTHEYEIGTEVIVKLALVREYSFTGTIVNISKLENTYHYGVAFNPLSANKEDVLFTFIMGNLLN